MGNGDTWGNRVQGVWGTGAWATWAIGSHGAIGYRGMGYRMYGPHGQWVQGYGPHGQWGTGVWSTLGHVYPLTPLWPLASDKLRWFK